jgi:CheY-like chemotaxis protein
MDKSQQVVLQDRPTILLIEAEPTLCVLLTDALQEAGFAVAQAGDVYDALRQARACVPDLIVIDLLPQASAARVLDRLQNDPATRSLPLIVIRGAGPRLDPGRSGRVDALLSSPADLDILFEHVWRVVNTRVLGAVNARGRTDPRVLVGDPEAALPGGALRSVEVAATQKPGRGRH